MRPWPYIGITGFTKEADVRTVLAQYPQNTKRRLMVGVLASKKTLAGQRTKYPVRYLSKAEIGSVFVDHPQTLNLIHYHTDSVADALVDELLQLKELAGPHFHGFQLNVKWPDPEALLAYHTESFSSTSERGMVAPRQHVIVLQCGKGAMKDVDNSPSKLAERVAEYKDVARYVLIDQSAGKGEALDVHLADDCFSKIGSVLPDIGLCIAGGLSVSTIESVRGLVSSHPDFSIDAEGRLRDADDHLVVSVAIEYVAAAHKLFREEGAWI